MKYKIKTVVFTILIIMGITGCWDSTDINKKDITMGVGVGKKDEEFIFYNEIANLVSENEDENNYKVIQERGKTFTEARDTIDAKVSNPIFLGAAKILIFSTSLTKDNIELYMNRFRNMQGYRKTLMIITTSDDINEIFSLQKNSQTSISGLIENLIKKLNKEGKGIISSASQVLNWISSEQSFLIPDIGIADKSVNLTGYTLINKAKYAGYIPYLESKGIVILLNGKAEWSFIVPFDDKKATVNVKLKKKKIKPAYSDNKTTFNIEFIFESKVKYFNEKVIFNKNQNVKVKNKLNEILYDEIKKTIDISQNIHKCDYLNFNNYFRIHYPNIYKNIDWNKEYIKSEFNITIINKLDLGEFDYNAKIFER